MNQVATGTVLVGKYRLDTLIGRGGMGSVWRAEHLGLGAPVAVKLLDQGDLTKSAEALGRFHREARAAAAIRSPHVVQILDHGVDEAIGAPFIVMELMEGESLAQRLTRVGRISPPEAARVITHVARALTRAHEANIVHRDLKPDNVFMVRNEDEEIAKVLDFGIAKAQAYGLGGTTGTATGAVMGTAYYMSPEQISGEKVDARSDIWALGVMACECLTGRRPFEAETIGGITLRICIEPIPRPSSFGFVPGGFDEWFAIMVHRDPAQRFASARDAADALRTVCLVDPQAPRTSFPVAPDNSAPRLAPPAFTEAPFSRSAGFVDQIPVAKPSRALYVLGGLAMAALLGFFSLRHSRARPRELPLDPVSSAGKASAAQPSVTVVPAACEASTNQCAGTTPQICVAGQWSSTPVSAGRCGAVCTPGAEARCNGSVPRTCDAAGQWQDGEACGSAHECQAGECVAKKHGATSLPTVATLHTSQPTPSATVSHPTLPVKPNCDPSYTLDSQGQKHFKPECFR